MFRRPGKNQDENGTLYNEELPLASPFNKYGTKKTEAEGMPPRLFDPAMPRAAPMDIQEDNWGNPKTTALPHHFEGLGNEEAPETTLGAGVTFRGTLSFERFLRIDGSFEGELLSQGKVVVGPTGRVKANLNLREAIIEGIVEGNITVQEKLELRGEASIKGDICAKALCVDEGVSIEGQVLVSPKTEQTVTPS